MDESTIEAVTPRNWVSGNVVITIRGYAMTGNALFNPNAKGDVTSVYLKNYKQPFAKASEESWKNGEWWTPADWIQNAVSFNADGSTFPECNIRRRKDIRWPSNTAGIRSNMLTVRCTNKLNYVRGRTDWK